MTLAHEQFFRLVPDIHHLLVDDRVQSLQTGLAEGVATVQAAGQPARQVVAAEAYDAQQVPPPQ